VRLGVGQTVKFGLLLAFFSLATGTSSGQTPPPQANSQRQALADSASAAPPSPMDYVNNQLPKWMRFSGELRERAEGFTGGGFNSANDDEYVLTRVWLNLSIQPTHWIQFFFQSADERALDKSAKPAGAPFRDSMDLRQAYISIGGTEARPVGVRFGRQEIEFGDGRIIGALPWANTARTFDGLRGSVISDGFRVDVFAVSVVQIYQDDFDNHIPGNNFYGAYTSFSKVVPKATVEPFFLWRRQSGLKTELGVPGISNYGSFGARWVGKISGGFDYDLTMAKQAGSLGNESIRAWAGHWLAGFTLAQVRYTPRFFAEYNYATGDHNPKDNTRGTFDQLYPTGHDKYGLSDLVGWQNIEHAREGVSFKLTKKLEAAARYSAYWLADQHDALYNSGAAVIARSKTGNSGRFVGQEADVIAAYKFNPRLALSAGFARLIPGTFLLNTTHGAAYNYPYCMTIYDF
jgi:Alginate export